MSAGQLLRDAGISMVSAGREDWIACHAKTFRELQEAKATIAQQAEQLAAAQKVIDTAGNLIAQKGRHNTEIAYKRLAKAIAEQKEGK